MCPTVSGVEVNDLEYFQESRTVRIQFDQTVTSPSEAVLATLNAIIDSNQGVLTPLHSIVDAEALDEVARRRNGSDGDVHISFPYEDFDICIHSYGVITITIPKDHTPTKFIKRGSKR